MSESESPWPKRLPEGVVLQAQVCEVSGSESWWRLVARPAGFSWEQTERTGGGWATRDVGSPWTDALNAIEAHDAVH